MLFLITEEEIVNKEIVQVNEGFVKIYGTLDVETVEANLIDQDLVLLIDQIVRV